MSSSRYIIGVDLGTSNCALAYIDTFSPDDGSRLLEIEQQQTSGGFGALPLLPSCLFLPPVDEKPKDSAIVGQYARDQLAYLPGRVVQSAKSWLAHQDALGTAQILPWGSDEIRWQDKVSAVEASAAYLSHLLRAWNASVAKYDESNRFENQRVIITVPASFTEDAQALTLEAARLAGYPADSRLLEEPQAAFYFWLEQHAMAKSAAEALREVFWDIDEGAKRIVVCDVGGGTTDFSLFELRLTNGKAEIVRSRVSDHLLLGGDNIDLALAAFLEPQLRKGDKPLTTAEWIKLTAQCREAKEKVLGGFGEPAQAFHISIAGRGSSLFSSARTASLPVEELRKVVASEFFPACSSEDYAERTASDPNEIGLPSVKDKAITRHLAAFLAGAQVDGILFAGGSLAPEYLRQRLLEVLSSWMPRPPIVLENTHITEAVARGAARFGFVLEHAQDIIHGGYPRSLYIEAESKGGAGRLVCIVPKGAEVGVASPLEDIKLRALVNQPIRVQPYYSASRDSDRPGDIIAADSAGVYPLPTLQTVLELPPSRPRPPHDQLLVTIAAEVTETGLLNIWCREIAQSPEEAFSWNLTFNVRKHAAEEPAVDAVEPEAFALPESFPEACAEIDAIFGKSKRGEQAVRPKRLISSLERVLKQPRNDWHPMLLRQLWPPLERGMGRRGRSVAHEAAWFYLAGFFLRPGYGTELDASYVSQLWRSFSSGMRFPKEAQVVDQWNIMWRRVAGGLEREKQEALYHSVEAKVISKGKSANLEAVRLACSLERIPVSSKEKLGSYLLRRILTTPGSLREHLMWELGRLGCRVPMYASTHYSVPPAVLMTWFRSLREVDWSPGELKRFHAIFAQACRLSGDASADLSSDERAEVVEYLTRTGASPQTTEIVEHRVESSELDKRMLFGDSLPLGLRLVKS